MSQREDKDFKTLSGIGKKVKAPLEKVNEVVPRESSVPSPSKSNPVPNVTMKPLPVTIQQVSIGDQMRGTYAGKEIAAVVVKNR